MLARVLAALSLIALLSACSSDDAEDPQEEDPTKTSATEDGGRGGSGNAASTPDSGSGDTGGGGGGPSSDPASSGGVGTSNSDPASSGGGGGSNPDPTSTGGNAPSTGALGATRTGEGTYYGATGEGACMLDASPGDLDVAALNAPDYQVAAWCGACAEVTGPRGTVRIRIVDLCPECKSGDLDFSESAFAKIAEVAQGRVPITWNFVACDVSGPVQYRYKDGSNQWWTGVQVLNHRLPIAKLEFSQDGGQSFTEVPREDYNYFVTTSGFGAGSVQVRITATDGQTLVDTLPPVQELLVVEGQAQFR